MRDPRQEKVHTTHHTTHTASYKISFATTNHRIEIKNLKSKEVLNNWFTNTLGVGAVHEEGVCNIVVILLSD